MVLLYTQSLFVSTHGLIRGKPQHGRAGFLGLPAFRSRSFRNDTQSGFQIVVLTKGETGRSAGPKSLGPFKPYKVKLAYRITRKYAAPIYVKTAIFVQITTSAPVPLANSLKNELTLVRSQVPRKGRVRRRNWSFVRSGGLASPAVEGPILRLYAQAATTGIHFQAKLSRGGFGLFTVGNK